MTVNDVIKLLPHLKTHGVVSVKCKDLEIMFRVEQLEAPNTGSVEQIKEVITKQEESLPPDLRADAIMDQDKVLNWSTQPGFDEQALPGTGDEPL